MKCPAPFKKMISLLLGYSDQTVRDVVTDTAKRDLRYRIVRICVLPFVQNAASQLKSFGTIGDNMEYQRLSAGSVPMSSAPKEPLRVTASITAKEFATYGLMGLNGNGDRGRTNLSANDS